MTRPRGRAVHRRPAGPIAWDRARVRPRRARRASARALDRDRPEVVVHAAAWTDVDGCARDPELRARAATATATGVLAAACAARGIDLADDLDQRGLRRRRGPTASAYSPDDPVAPGNPYGASKLAGERARDRARSPGRPRARASGSPGRPGCSARRAATSRARSSTPPTGPRPPASRSGSSATSGARPPTRRTSPTRSSSCWPRTRTAGIHHLVNGLFATRALWAALRRRPGRAAVERRARPRRPPGSAPSRAAALGRPRPDPAAVRRAAPAVARRDGRLRARRSQRARRRRRATRSSPERPAASSLPGVRYGRGRPAWPMRAARSASCGGPRRSRHDGTFVQANLSTSAAGVLRGLHLHRRQLDYGSSPRAGVRRARRRPAGHRRDGRPAGVETRELGADDWVVIPTGVAHGFLALEPLELLYLVTNAYDGSDELGFAWDDPAVGVGWPRSSARPPTGARSSPSVTARTRRWPSSWCACAPDVPVRTPTAPHQRPARDRTRPPRRG